jgi:Fe2+ or Zn2+ uptake regulation protein
LAPELPWLLGVASDRGRTALKCAQQTLRYLTRHPHAKDTAEGIATWWLQRERIEQAVGDVYDALALLLDRGLIIERRGPDRSTYYELNREQLDEVPRFLAEHAGGSPAHEMERE